MPLPRPANAAAGPSTTPATTTTHGASAREQDPMWNNPDKRFNLAEEAALDYMYATRKGGLTCTFPGCKENQRRLSSNQVRNRHVWGIHLKTLKRIPCTICTAESTSSTPPGPAVTLSRKDAWDRHMEDVHGPKAVERSKRKGDGKGAANAEVKEDEGDGVVEDGAVFKGPGKEHDDEDYGGGMGPTGSYRMLYA